MTETAKERIYREALGEISRSLPVNSKLDLVIAEALIKAKYQPVTTDKLSVEKLQEQLNTELTIPKSIAEQADKIAYYALQKEGIEEFRQWFDYKQDGYMDIIYAYLNPLTRDLVKVVEG